MNAAPSLASSPAPRESRRISTRRAVVVPCQAVRLEDFKLISDRTLDVSVEGLMLPIAEHEAVLTGETLIVSFPIPGTWIDAEATVTRVVHGRRPGDDGLAIGVIFDVMSASSRAALAGFLHGRPPPLPRRGPLSRLRRGLDAPQLADHALMRTSLAAPVPFVSEQDVEDDDDAFDPLGILREVAQAWKRLASPA